MGRMIGMVVVRPFAIDETRQSASTIFRTPNSMLKTTISDSLDGTAKTSRNGCRLLIGVVSSLETAAAHLEIWQSYASLK